MFNVVDERDTKVFVKTVFFKMGLVVASSLLAVGGVEATLSLLDYTYIPLSIRVLDNNENDARKEHIFQSNAFKYDPELLWKPLRDGSVFNSQGYRGAALELKQPGEFRILAVGDSNTLGWAGNGGANWPEELEKLMPEDRPFSVTNAGVWGYSSMQGLRRLEEAAELEPDIVLISFGSNDAHPVPISDEQYSQHTFKHIAGIAGNELRISQLLRAAWDQIMVDDLKAHQSGEIVHRVSLPEFRSNLVQMIDYSRSHGAIPVLLTRPYVGISINPNWWKTYGAQYREATVAVAREQNVLLIDVFARFYGYDSCFKDESHFTRKGHQRAALYIYEQLKPLIGVTSFKDDDDVLIPVSTIDLPIKFVTECRGGKPWTRATWDDFGNGFSYALVVEHLATKKVWEFMSVKGPFVEGAGAPGKYRIRVRVSNNCEAPKLSKWQQYSVPKCEQN